MPKAETVRDVIDLIRQVRRALSADEAIAWTNLDLTLPQLKTLFFISCQGTTNTKTVAESFGVTSSNMTGIIDRLVKQGLVNRQENPANRRMYELRVTKRGEDKIAELRQTGTRFLSEVLTQMSEEDLAVFARGLSLLKKAAEANRGDL